MYMGLHKSGSWGAKRLAHGRRFPVQTIVLRTLYTTGLIGTALLAPKAVRLFRYLDRSRAVSAATRERLRRTVSRMEKSGLIRQYERGGRALIELTEKGEAAAEQAIFDTYQIPEPARWDGRWRLVIFDVRESRRNARRALRLALRNTGFYLLQDSVWTYPYPCDEFIQLVRARLKCGPEELLTCIAEGFENDRRLRSHFGLN